MVFNLEQLKGAFGKREGEMSKHCIFAEEGTVFSWIQDHIQYFLLWKEKTVKQQILDTYMNIFSHTHKPPLLKPISE